MCYWAPSFFNFYNMYIEHDLPFPQDKDFSKHVLKQAIDCPVELVDKVNDHVQSMYTIDWLVHAPYETKTY